MKGRKNVERWEGVLLLDFIFGGALEDEMVWFVWCSGYCNGCKMSPRSSQCGGAVGQQATWLTNIEEKKYGFQWMVLITVDFRKIENVKKSFGRGGLIVSGVCHSNVYLVQWKERNSLLFIPSSYKNNTYILGKSYVSEKSRTLPFIVFSLLELCSLETYSVLNSGNWLILRKWKAYIHLWSSWKSIIDLPF